MCQVISYFTQVLVGGCYKYVQSGKSLRNYLAGCSRVSPLVKSNKLLFIPEWTGVEIGGGLGKSKAK